MLANSWRRRPAKVGTRGGGKLVTAPGLIVLVEPGAPVTSPGARATLARVRGLIVRDPAVAGAAGAQVSRDGRMAYVAVTFRDLGEARLGTRARRRDETGTRQLLRSFSPASDP